MAAHETENVKTFPQCSTTLDWRYRQPEQAAVGFGLNS
jgi:hypothetical protein